MKDSEYAALNSDGEIVSCHKNPQIAKAEAIIKGIYSPFIVPVYFIQKDHIKYCGLCGYNHPGINCSDYQ